MLATALAMIALTLLQRASMRGLEVEDAMRAARGRCLFENELNYERDRLLQPPVRKELEPSRSNWFRSMVGENTFRSPYLLHYEGAKDQELVARFGSKLKIVSCRGRLSNSEFVRLTANPGLQELYLHSASRVSPSSLNKFLRRARQLRVLYLRYADVSAETLELACSLPELEELAFISSKLPQACDFRQARSLQVLTLRGSVGSPSTLEQLKFPHQLKLLALDGLKCDARTLAKTHWPEELASLSLNSTEFDDSAIRGLPLGKLQVLRIDSTRVTEEGRARLGARGRDFLAHR